MKAALRAIVFAGCALVAFPERASAADWWGWLESFSGPGPWHLYDSFQAELCPRFPKSKTMSDGTQQPKIATFTSVDRGRLEPCFGMEYRRFETADPDPLVGAEVSARFYEWGVYFPIDKAVTVGADIGFVRFSSPGKVSYKGVLSPVATLKPLRLIREWRNRESRWFSVLQVQVGGSFIMGSLTGADFGIAPEKVDTNWEFVKSWGFVIDAGEIFGLYKK